MKRKGGRVYLRIGYCGIDEEKGIGHRRRMKRKGGMVNVGIEHCRRDEEKGREGKCEDSAL